MKSKNSLILATVLIIAVIFGAYLILHGKSTKNVDVISSVNELIPLVPETLKIDDANPSTNGPITGMAVFTSNTLGIEFTYPKVLPDTRIVNVTESGNTLTVSAGFSDGYTAEIFHKEDSETFEESILRQVVKVEYQNNPCHVVKVSENMYEITYPGDMNFAGGWSDEGTLNVQKCGGSPYAYYGFSTDPSTGGFYIATVGTQEPSFGVPGTSAWWPVGIKFIK